ncbi:MAG: V-type ATPase 116kDa subunit family protein [Candidatus Fermentibacteria bacterium]
MSLDAVSKIEILCHSLTKEMVLNSIEASGKVHLIDLSELDIPENEDFLKPADINTEDLVEEISGLEKAILFLREETRGEVEVARSQPPSLSEKELMALLQDKRLLEDARRAWFVAVQKAKLEGALKELMQEELFLQFWKDLPVPLEELRSKGDSCLVAGTLEKDAIAKAHLLEKENPLFHLEVVLKENKTEKVVAVTHESVTRDVMQALSELGFAQQDFGIRTGMVPDLLEAARKKIELIKNRMSALHDRAVKLALETGRFRTLLDAACLLLERTAATRSGYSSSHVYLFKAWIRTADLKSFSENLGKLGEVSVEEIEPEEGEIPPSPLTEKETAAPYTLLTDMYGQPTRSDPDPTPLMAPFYAFFFGICIGDAGYGIALALGCAAGWYLVRKRHGNPRLFQLLFQGGLASIFVGIFLGGWFGISFDSLPAFLQAPANLLNGMLPGYQPGQAGQEGFAVSKHFLYLTLGLGLVQLTAGIVVNLVKRWKAGEKFAAVLDQSGWLLATAGLFPWLFNHYLLNGALYDLNGPLDKVFIYMLAAGSLLIFIMGGRSAKGFGKIGLGAYAMYGIVNLLGDVLSYSRLFALALSSAIIAQVINQIAGMLLHQMGIPLLGIILAAFVVIAGHTFNMAMAALSGFIHTARLQFVEFFGKFYDGTGVPFKPLRYEPRYVHIERE